MNYFSLQVIIEKKQQLIQSLLSRSCWLATAGFAQLDFLEDLEIVVDDPQTKVVTHNF